MSQPPEKRPPAIIYLGVAMTILFLIAVFTVVIIVHGGSKII